MRYPARMVTMMKYFTSTITVVWIKIWNDNCEHISHKYVNCGEISHKYVNCGEISYKYDNWWDFLPVW